MEDEYKVGGSLQSSSGRVLYFCCSTYVVVAPQILRACSTYDVAVTILRATSSVNVDVSLQKLRNVSVASNTTTVSAGERNLQEALLSQKGRALLGICQLVSIAQYVERDLLLFVRPILRLQIYRCVQLNSVLFS